MESSETTASEVRPSYSRLKGVMVPVIFEKEEQQPPPLTRSNGEKCYACIVSSEEKIELASALEVSQTPPQPGREIMIYICRRWGWKCVIQKMVVDYQEMYLMNVR